MNAVGMLASPRVVLGKIDRLGLARILEIEEQSPAPHWSGQEFLVAMRAGDIRGAVAVSEGCIVGFALYKATPAEGFSLGGLKNLLHWCRPRSPGTRTNSRPIELLRIGVHRAWRRQGIGRALLEAIHQEARNACAGIQAIVAESNLPLQLFLHAANYNAVRILRGHYGDEDGYVMERPAAAANVA